MRGIILSALASLFIWTKMDPRTMSVAVTAERRSLPSAAESETLLMSTCLSDTLA